MPTRPSTLLMPFSASVTASAFSDEKQMPRMPWPDLLALNRHADVALDTFHYGGGNTSCESVLTSSPNFAGSTRVAA